MAILWILINAEARCHEAEIEAEVRKSEAEAEAEAEWFGLEATWTLIR